MKITKPVYYVALSLIVLFSAWYYLPCFFSFFNSDQAIHVLMTKDFRLPRDYYYWGQNRLGSLLPMVSHWIYKIVRVHPVYICSFVQYLFLLIPFLLIARHINNLWLRLCFLLLIFLPFNSYNALLYVGHPYSQQFFCGTLFVLFFMKAKNFWFDGGETKLSSTQIFKLTGYLILSAVFYVIGIWVSEFDAVLVLIPCIILLPTIKTLWNRLGPLRLSCVLAVVFITLLIGYKWYSYTKDVSINDPQYSKPFIRKKKEIRKEFKFMKLKIKQAFTYDNPNTLYENTVYLGFFALVIYLSLKSKEIRRKKGNVLSVGLVVTSVVSSVVLFFSYWNYKSEFCPRYYIPVYIMLSLALILYLDKTKAHIPKLLLFAFISFHSIIYTYRTVINLNVPSPFETFSDFKTLPDGTLIGDYWEVHLINSVAIDNLNSINFEHSPVIRTYNWRESALSAEKFYFLNNETAKKYGLKDTITQFGAKLVATGKKYPLKAAEVLEYKKLTSQ